MTLQASGQITSQDIADEIGETGQHDLAAFAALAVGDSNITNEPHDITDWYGYNHIKAPNAPTIVSGAYNGGTLKIDLVWTEGAVDANHDNEDLYRFQESVNTGSGFPAYTNNGTSAQDTTSISRPTGGLSGDSVRVRMRAENVGGESAWDALASAIDIP
jgi:hypothetical protein